MYRELICLRGTDKNIFGLISLGQLSLMVFGSMMGKAFATFILESTPKWQGELDGEERIRWEQ